jgi:hypothetical protein
MVWPPVSTLKVLLADSCRAELGPCRIDQNLSVHANHHSWNEVSNVLFLTQPVGVEFSYGTKAYISLLIISDFILT